MKVLLLLALAAIGQCALLGSKKCTYGPSYWCSHIHHAKECGAMQHCMTTVWKNEKLDMAGSTETCYDTIKVLDVVRHSSDSDILEQMAIGCTGLSQDKRSLCKELMMHDQNEVHLLLTSDLPTHHVAVALGLCGSFSDNVPHPVESVQSGLVSSDYCKDCVNFFGDLREIFNNSEGQLEDLIKDMVCSKTGPLESLCDQFVDQYAGMLFDAMFQLLDPQRICQQLQLCANQKHAMLMKRIKDIMSKGLKGSEECSVCKGLAQDLQNVMRDPSVQQELLGLLQSDVCTLLSGDLADQCKAYVSEYGPLVFQFLVAELDPASFCATLGLCNATQVANSKMTTIPLHSSLGIVQILPESKEKAATDPQCALCEFVMNNLENILRKNATQAEIEAALEKVCSLLPATVRAECDAFVQNYEPTLVKMLLQYNPAEVCSLLEVCSTQTHQPLKVTKPVMSAETCEVCKLVMGYVEKVVTKPDNEKKVEEILDQVCNELPGNYKQTCLSLIDEYYPTLVNLLLQSFNPSKICTELSLCSSSSDSLLFRPMAELQPAKPHLLGDDKCLYGPSYWCASEENAKLCGAEKHCAEMLKRNEE